MNESIFSQNKDLLQNLILENESIGIVIGEPHNIDKVAAGLSFYLAFSGINKDAQVVSKKEPLVEFSNLVGINKIKRDFAGDVKTFIVSIPYKEGEVEKISYNTENGRLNLNIFAAEDKKITFSESDIQYIKKGSSPSLVFAIGVQDISRISEFVDSSVKVVNIDNNPSNTLFGDVIYASSSFSSVSEIVARILKDLAIPVDLDASQNLLDGISYATRNFSSFSTTPFAFEAASFLLQNGARRKQMEGQDRKRPPFNQPQQQPQREQQHPFQRPLNTQNEYGNEGGKEEQQESQDLKKVPRDWYAPKVFKGSSPKKQGQS